MLQSISLAIFVICCLLAVFLVRARSDMRQSNLFFAGFLLLTAFDTSAWFAQDFWAEHQVLDRVRYGSAFLQMPFFYGFIVSACFDDRKLRGADALHLVPLLVALSVALSVSGFRWYYLLPWASTALHVQFFAYIAACALALRTFRQRYLDRRSDAGSRTFIWLAQITAVSFVAHLLVVAKSFVLMTGGPTSNFQTLQIVVASIAFLVTIWVALQALLHPETFRKVDRGPVEAKPTIRAAGAELEAIHRVMADRQPYLAPDLRLEQLAVLTGHAPRELSAILNQEAGERFFDFVNRYRVEYAKRLLVLHADSSVTEVMLETGFNSKSSFNTAFRKFAGTTPSAFRKAAKVEQKQDFA